MIRTASLAVAALTICLAAPAWSGPSRADRARAKKLFKAGQKAYKAQDYERAASLFARGYKRDPRPAFLLNIAQAHRAANKLALALANYERYLEADPDTSLRAQVEKLIVDLKAELALLAKQRAAEEAKKKPPEFVTPPPPPPKPKQETPIYRKWWFWTAIGVAVVGV